MKKLNIYSLFILATMSLVACEPVEDRDELPATTVASDFVYSITQDIEDDYIIYVENSTPSVYFSWDYTWGKSFEQKDTLAILIPGQYNIEILASTPGGFVNLDYPVTVADINPDAFVEPEWEYLSNMLEGKTWVWAIDNNYTENHYIWGNSGLNDGYPSWWGRSAGDAAEDNIDIDGKMTFDLNGARNFAKVEYDFGSGNTVTSTGSFDIDFDNHDSDIGIARITFTGTTILHGISQNDDKKVVYDFDIVKLTEDELILNRFTESNDFEAWNWIFKREGYNYSQD